MKFGSANIGLVILIMLLTSCMFIGHRSDTQPEILSDSLEVKEAESRLLKATLQLLNSSKQNEPESYSKARMVFEEALAEYLLVTRQNRETELRITRDGKTYLLPIHILKSRPLPEETASDDTLPIVMEAFGPKFRGDILDLAWLPSAEESPDRLLILFADSLVTLLWPDMKASSKIVIHIGQEFLASIRSAFPSGLLVPRKSGLRDDPELMILTSSLRSPLTLHRQEGRLVLTDSLSTVEDPRLPGCWNMPSGQEIFRSLSGEITAFRSLRSLPDSQIVLLDEAGYLRWISADLREEIWKSEHAFGDRLFLLNTDKIAICNSRQDYFWVFQREADQMRLLGKSPKLPGYVGAIIEVQFSNQSGFFVSVMTMNEDHKAESQLQFLADSLLYEQSPLPFKEPRFPDHFARIVFVPEENAEEILNQLHDDVFPFLEANTYETLFHLDSQGKIAPLLASRASSDVTGRQWYIRLKEGVRFSDGTLLTVGDVYRSWKRNWLSCNDNHCTMQWLWKNIRGVEEFLSRKHPEIKGIRLMDARTLVVTLKEPRPNFKEHLAQLCFRVRKIADSGPELGTGPYQIQEIRNHSALTAVQCQRNIYYHFGQPPFQEITVLFQSGRITDAFLQNRLFSAVVRHKKNIDYFKQVNITQIRPFPLSSVYFLALNPSAKVLSDNQSRRYIVNSLLGPNVLASIINEADCEVVHSFFSDLTTLPAPPENDVLPFSRAVKIAFRAADAIARQIAERLAARLQQRQIPVSPIQPLTDQEFEQIRQSKNYQVLIDCFVPSFSSPLYNFFQLLNNEYMGESQITRAVENSLSAPALDDIRRYEKQLMEQVILFPLLRVQNYAVLSSELRDVSLLGCKHIDFARAWVPRKP